MKFTNYHHIQNLSLGSENGFKSVGIAVKSTAHIKSALCYLNGIFLAWIKKPQSWIKHRTICFTWDYSGTFQYTDLSEKMRLLTLFFLFVTRSMDLKRHGKTCSLLWYKCHRSTSDIVAGLKKPDIWYMAFLRSRQHSAVWYIQWLLMIKCVDDIRRCATITFSEHSETFKHVSLSKEQVSSQEFWYWDYFLIIIFPVDHNF